jgi:hypothetical protein
MVPTKWRLLKFPSHCVKNAIGTLEIADPETTVAIQFGSFELPTVEQTAISEFDWFCFK